MQVFEKSICGFLDQGEAVVLVTILSQAGSTPRTSGAKMIVREDLSIVGTIGGGLVEGEAIKTAGDVFKTGADRLRVFDLTAQTADSMDMICGGRMEVLFELIEPTPHNLELFSARSTELKAGEKKLMVIALPAIGNRGAQAARCLISPDGNVIGNCDIENEVLIEAWQRTSHERAPVALLIQGRRYIAEPVFLAGAVFLFGGGHISKELAMLTSRVGFHTIVFDDREEFANRSRFSVADEVRVCPNYEDLFSGFEINDDTYVVIVTRGHRHDKTVLAQALGTRAGYIGMIGSRTKRDAIYKALLAEGFSEKEIKRVASPIGLSIGAETPEEIAISIVSELIKERASKMGRLKIAL
jgi:xanthine dehydrogenase accessory factor